MTSPLSTVSDSELTAQGPDLSGLAPLHPLLPHAVMYTLPHCPNCDRLKTLFKAAKIPVVAAPLDDEPDAYQLFHGELHVAQTPIVLIHNTFTTPTYFSGFSSDLAQLAVRAIRSRLRDLEDSLDLPSIDLYVADLGAAIEPGQSCPFIRPDVFAALAASHSDCPREQVSRAAAPQPLSASSALLDMASSESAPPLH
ncbi:glutaredoxin family protein [Rhodococcoides fascians]|uniref:glutaredoxin family protein n=1 Tax=Rhodococcoides fascians TaxID=1828 RepID=UPI00050BECAF|nr:glutaredoxin domain-containing protein [Rhodococcus fascians]